MNRAPAETVKFATPFGAMFLAVARDKTGIASIQISHQIRDRSSQVAELVDAINGAMRELCGET